jgi:hypothetical protein
MTLRNLVFLCSSMVLLAGCASSKVLQPDGLAYAKIGATMPEPGAFKVRGHAVRDTVFEDEKYTWRVAKVAYSQGVVYVEEDFYGSGKISRVRVETPQVKLANGLQTGQQVSALLAITSDWYISPMPKFGLFDVYSKLFPRTHFVVQAPGVPLDKSWDEYKLDQFPQEAQITMITVY